MIKLLLPCLCLFLPLPGRCADHGALIERAAIAAHDGQPARARHDLMEALKADPKDPALSRALDQLNHGGRIDLDGPSGALMDAQPATPAEVRSAMKDYGAALERLAIEGWQQIRGWAAQAKGRWDRYRARPAAVPSQTSPAGPSHRS
jgi:hypothetical protein